MKQAYFFLAIILMGGFASAQITLNTSAWPSPGSDFSFSFDNSSHPDSTILNATGANQSWDFSTLTPFGNYSETYFDISNSPHQNDHPDADFWKLECAPCGGTGPDTLFYYYLSDVNGFYKTEVGVVLNGTYITFPFASPDTLITSLFTFGSNHTYYSDWYGIGQPMDTLHAERLSLIHI